MDNKNKGFFDLRIIIGLLVIGAGVILFLSSLGMDINIHIWDYWPVLLILIGIKKILDPIEYRQYYWGGILISIGVLFQLNNLDIIDFHFQDLWPIIIILIGFEIIKTALYRKKYDKDGQGREHHKFFSHLHDAREVGSDYIQVSAILGGGEYNFSNKNLKGGSVTAIMGGCEIDLRDAQMHGDQIYLDITTIMGGVEVRVPTEWEVIIQGMPILAGMENKTRPDNGGKKRLVIKGTAIMAGVEIKN